LAMVRCVAEHSPRIHALLAVLECCEWAALVLVDFQKIPISKGVLAVVLATNVYRICFALVALPLMMSVAVFPARWQPLLNLHVIITSATIHCGILLVINTVSDPRAEDETCQRSPCGEARNINVSDSWLFINCMCSMAWFYTNLFWRPWPADAEPQPKPRVDSFTVRDVISECGDAPCAICLEDFSVDCTAARLPCDHVFHDDCVRRWFSRGRSQFWCPMRCPGVASSSGTDPPGAASRTAAAEAWSQSTGRARSSSLPVLPTRLGHAPTRRVWPSSAAAGQNSEPLSVNSGAIAIGNSISPTRPVFVMTSVVPTEP